MEVYRQIKIDFIKICFFTIAFVLVCGFFDVLVDNTDKDGFNRSGVMLITDYGTGLQYLYRGGALIPRLDSNGDHIKVD